MFNNHQKLIYGLMNKPSYRLIIISTIVLFLQSFPLIANEMDSSELIVYEGKEWESMTLGHRQDAGSSVFPLLKHMVPEKDWDKLPRPYGLSYVFHTQQQWYDITSVKLNGVEVPKEVLEHVYINSITYTNSLRADVWLFPFLNTFLYGGYTQGGADVYVQPPNLPAYFDGTFDVSALTIGPGVTASFGFGKMFLASTFTYVFVTRPSADSSTSAAWTNTIGYSFPHFNLWTGGMWQQPGRDQGGSLGDGIRYDATIETENSWNVLAGVRVSLIRQRLELMYQQGFGRRTSSTLNLTWRYGR